MLKISQITQSEQQTVTLQKDTENAAEFIYCPIFTGTLTNALVSIRVRFVSISNKMLLLKPSFVSSSILMTI
jgi:hypothetical protein